MDRSYRTVHDICRSERGIALVVALLLMLTIAFMGFGLSVSARGSQGVGTAFKNQQSSFEIATAGLERAREFVRQARFADTTATNYQSMLTARLNGALCLSNSNQLSNLGTTNGSAKDASAVTNTPILGPTSFGNGSYQVFMTNDNSPDYGSSVSEGTATCTSSITSAADRNDTITLTSFGSAANQVGFSVVQGVYAPSPQLTLPRLPALLTMPGPDININLPNGNASMDGVDSSTSPPACNATIAVVNTTAAGGNNTADVHNAMKRDQNFTTCNPTTGASMNGINAVDNMIVGSNPYDAAAASNTPVFTPAGGVCPAGNPISLGGANCLTNVAYLTQLRNNLRSMATSMGCYGTAAACAATMNSSSATNPKIVYINGDLTSWGGNFYGILVVTGNMTTNGGPLLNGALYAIGAGNISRAGGGGSDWCGGTLIANINSPVTVGGVQLAGVPTYTINGGGNNDFASNASCSKNLAGENIRFGSALKLLSFQQLR